MGVQVPCIVFVKDARQLQGTDGQMTTWTNRRGTESDREPTAIVDQSMAVVEVCSGALRVAKMPRRCCVTAGR